MPQLDSSGLVILHNRTPEEREVEPVTWYNGREIHDEEQGIFTQAKEKVREREASMLDGLIR